MATISFELEFVIKDEKAADAMIRAMEKAKGRKWVSTSDLPEALERGRLMLERLSSH